MPNTGHTVSQSQTYFSDAPFSSVNWYSRSNVENDDSNAAYVDWSYVNSYSKVFWVYNFGFNIPAESTILGIEVTGRFRTDNDIGSNSDDDQIHTVNIGDNTGTWDTFSDDKTTSKTVIYTGAPQTKTWGGATDLWGATLTPTLVNDISFGIFITLHHDRWASTHNKTYIEYLTMDVYYSGGDETPSGSIMMLGFQ